MSYKQVRSFSTSKGGSKAGYCLQNVRLGYGIAAKHPNAITAWHNTEQHKDRNIPSGVDVPLYYSYKTDGHINVRLADGRVWNDGQIFSSLAAYEKGRTTVKYLGWGESVNGVRVIQQVTDQIKEGGVISSAKYLHSQFQKYFGRNATQEEINTWVGKRNHEDLIDTLNAQETTAKVQKAMEVGRIAIRDDWQGQITKLQEIVARKDTSAEQKLAAIKQIVNK